MKIGVVIPVGPGHKEISCIAGATASTLMMAGDTRLRLVDDLEGKKGRSAARNQGIREMADWGAEWIFLLDADDMILSGAMTEMVFRKRLFDAIYTPAHVRHLRQGRVAPEIRTASPEPTWEWILEKGPIHSVMMGNFYRTSALLDHPFREDLDHGEDWEHHLSFMAGHSWTVAQRPMVLADTISPSAGGPRGGSKDWAKEAEPFFRFWRKRGRVPLTKEERATRYWG